MKRHEPLGAVTEVLERFAELPFVTLAHDHEVGRVAKVRRTVERKGGAARRRGFRLPGVGEPADDELVHLARV